MQNDLFPETWPQINVEDYVRQHELAFNRLDLKILPHYTLMDKIKLAGLLTVLLLNDPRFQKRPQLNTAMLNEVQRQILVLMTEYNWRVQEGLIATDSEVRTFLGKHIQLDPVVKPLPVVIGMKSLKLSARRG